MYLLYNESESEYAETECHNCWLRDTTGGTDIDAKTLRLPLCHALAEVAELSSDAKRRLANGGIYNGVILGFEYVWQVLQHMATFRNIRINEWQIHQVADNDSRYVVTHCGSERHIQLGDDIMDADDDYHDWKLDQNLWFYAESQGEDWQQNLSGQDILADIVFQLGDIEWYLLLSDAGYILPTPEYQQHIRENFATYQYCARPEAVVAFASRVPAVVTAQMLSQYITRHKATWQKLECEILPKLDLEAIMASCADMIMPYILAENCDVTILQNFYAMGWFRPTEAVFRIQPPWIYDIQSIPHRATYVMIRNVATVKWLLTLPEVDVLWLTDTYLIGWSKPADSEISCLLHAHMPPELQLVALHKAMYEGKGQYIQWLLTQGGVQISTQDLAVVAGCHASHLGIKGVKYLQSQGVSLDPQIVVLVKYSHNQKFDADFDAATMLNAAAMFRLVQTHIGDVLTLIKADAMANVDYQATRVAKTCLFEIQSSIISDLAPDLEDVSLLEFVLLTRCISEKNAADIVQVLQTRGQLVDTITTRWQHYFAAGTDKRYACQDGHADCYTLNLWFAYCNVYRGYGMRYIWQHAWLNPAVTQLLAPYIHT